MEKDKVVILLEKEIEFAKDGGFSKTGSLVFFPPTMDVYDESAELSQLAMQALFDQKGNADDKEEEKDETLEFTAAIAKAILLSSSSVKFVDIVKLFKNLAVKVGTFDGTVPITEDTFSKITPADMTNMVCEYLANFIFPSLLSGLDTEKGKSNQ